MTITLPVADVNQTLASPTDRYNESVEKYIGKVDTLDWGYQVSDERYEVSAARISFRNDASPDMNLARQLGNISTDFTAWFEIVVQWTSAWLNEIIPPIGREERRSPLRVATNDGRRAGSSIELHGHIGYGMLSAEQVHGAFKHASRGESVPLEYQFVKSAGIALLHADHRKAVIDATTAVEVALSAQLTDAFSKQKLGSAQVEQIIKQANGVVGLFELYVGLGRATPTSKASLASRLASVRNKAVHSGQPPSRSETVTALQQAIAMVRSCRPLPQQ